MFNGRIIEDAKNHARECFPKESCGYISEDKYIPCINVHETPEKHFKISETHFLKALIEKRIQAIIHSHPDSQDYPSYDDMVGQVETAVAWGIIMIHKGAYNNPFWFGDQAPVPPYIGRPFRHGVTDCYALARDFYRLEYGIQIPPRPRRPEWWFLKENLFQDYWTETGFEPIEKLELVGDGLIGKVLGPVSNHCGVYIGNGLVLHHLAGRLSRVEPVNRWMKFVNCCWRYKGGLPEKIGTWKP